MDKLLRYFSIARKAGLLELGEEDTGAAVRGGKAKVVFLAADASENALHRTPPPPVTTATFPVRSG